MKQITNWIRSKLCDYETVYASLLQQIAKANQAKHDAETDRDTLAHEYRLLGTKYARLEATIATIERQRLQEENGKTLIK